MSGGALNIGGLRVDPALDEAVRDGITIKLEPRAMRLLVCLAERAGQVVSVDELLSLVWRDVVVSPDSVYAAVAGLRRTLGDDPKKPTYIANVMRRGYRLIAPVSAWIDAPAPAPAAGPAAAPVPVPVPVPVPAPTPTPAPTSTPAPAAKWRRRAYAGLALMGAIAALLIAHRVQQPNVTPAALPADEHSVAVLPFLDLSEKKDQQYFADGMSEELIDALAKVPALHVPARTSSFYFQNKSVPLSDIAQALRVRHVLEGSVRRSGDMLRITAQLIRVDTGYHVWSQTFDRPIADIFKVQDEISDAVVRELEGSLLPSASTRPAPTTSSAAYLLLLKARSIAFGGENADYELGKAYVQQALVLDPNFAAGWAELASYTVWEITGLGDVDLSSEHQLTEKCAPARRAAAEALRLDVDAVDAHNAMAQVYRVCDWNWTAAEAEHEQALKLDPSNSRALRALSDIHWRRQQPQLALHFAQLAVAADPLDAYGYWQLALAQGQLGELQAAESTLRKAIELSPATPGLHALLSNALLALGKPQEALIEIGREPDAYWRDNNMLFIDDALGRHHDADLAFESFKMKYPNDSVTFALFYACRGDVDRAVAWLQKFANKRFTITDVPNRQACWMNLEKDGRYREILRKYDSLVQPQDE